jgi:pimeloyl-ACP methyl ester carboxylesterase
MQPLFEHRMRFAGHETRVLELEGDGPPVVLLHGWADSADTWRRLLDGLGRSDRRAIAVDLPGFGTADRLDGERSVMEQLDAFADEVVRYAREDGAGAPVIAGNSLGGAVSLRLATRAGETLTGIVPIAPAGLDMPRWFQIIERDPVVRTLLSLPSPVPESVVRAGVGRAFRLLAFADQGKCDANVVDAFTSHHRDATSVSSYLSTARRMLPELQEPMELAEIPCPVLLVWGDRDRLVPHRGAEVVLDALPGTRVELLEGVGHCPQIEACDRVLELLLEFPRERLARAA